MGRYSELCEQRGYELPGFGCSVQRLQYCALRNGNPGIGDLNCSDISDFSLLPDDIALPNNAVIYLGQIVTYTGRTVTYGS